MQVLKQLAVGRKYSVNVISRYALFISTNSCLPTCDSFLRRGGPIPPRTRHTVGGARPRAVRPDVTSCAHRFFCTGPLAAAAPFGLAFPAGLGGADTSLSLSDPSSSYCR